MRFLLAALLMLTVAACRNDVDIVGPRHCETVTSRGLHADTTVTNCR